MSWATVPTTISVSAVEILNQMARRVATSAKPTHRDARTQVLLVRSHQSGLVAEFWYRQFFRADAPLKLIISLKVIERHLDF
jgi:hypothetical protein